MQRIIIVGAGASGLAASIEAGRAGADVVLLESGKRAGKKLLATGNGRCNFTNLEIDGDSLCYHSGDPSFVWQVLSSYPASKVIDWFSGIGISPASRGSLVYPRSFQASAILDALRFQSEEAGVKLICEERVDTVKKKGGSFLVQARGQSYIADRVILAAGGKAAPSTGSDGSGAALCRSLGHHIIQQTPALVPLRCSGQRFSAMAGVRAQAAVRVLFDGETVAHDTGEVQFTAYGLSGIPVMQVSGSAARLLARGKKCLIEVDLVPEMKEEELFALLCERRGIFHAREGAQILMGLLPKKLGEEVLKNSHIALRDRAQTIPEAKLTLLAHEMKHLSAVIDGTMDWEHAQVTSGGVDIREIDPQTMESRICPGLYITGELLDVDGLCGGYNLHWAWCTGIIAGRSATLSR